MGLKSDHWIKAKAEKYVHHQDISKIDILTLVPQFLGDTGEPPEIEVGQQLLKKKKNGPKK